MLAELRQTGDGLGDRDLHVVAGNALVIGHGLIVDQRALRVIGLTATETRPGRLPSGVPDW